jgi:hypothetical protein
MFSVSRAAGALAALLLFGASGCGGSSPLAGLENPGIQGVEAMRADLKSALQGHDDKRLCELVSSTWIWSNGGSTRACEQRVRSEGGPYSASLEDYAAGGHVEFRGNEASYQAPPGTNAYDEYEASDGGSGTATVFVAVYSEGSWRLTDPDE